MASTSSNENSNQRQKMSMDYKMTTKAVDGFSFSTMPLKMNTEAINCSSLKNDAINKRLATAYFS